MSLATLGAELTDKEREAISKVVFHEKMQFLFESHRYKVAHSGRAGLKSWSFARALLICGAINQERILCGREIQKSISDSVHRLLQDQIDSMGLDEFYTVTKDGIVGRNDTNFLFAGFSDQTVESMKSFEGVTKCWIEEAVNISKRSYSLLIPTIRKEDSEIWVSFNPELDTDETYVRFIDHPPPDAVVVETNWRDNLWMTKVLEDERLHCLKTEPKEEYENIWEGVPRSAVAGAIYAKEVMLAKKENRICRVPYDPRLKVHTVWDLGHRDYTAIGLFQKGVSEFRMIGYIQEHQKKIHEYAADLNALSLNWGWDWLPHDGFIEDIKAPSCYAILKAHGRRVKPKVGTKLPIPNIEVETGIKALRGIFHRLVIDSEMCDTFIQCMRRYRRAISNTTGEPAAPVHDIYSHGADMARYFALCADKMTNDEELHAPPKRPAHRPFDPGTGAL